MQEDPDRAQQLVLALFADDVTVLAQHKSSDIATADARWAVNVISEWSKEWKLELNSTKSESAFFSTWTHESDFKPEILINQKIIPFNKTPKLLGVRYDRTLSFHTHTEEVAQTVSAKLGILAAVGNSQWGWDKYHIGQLYYAYMRTKMDYC